MRRHFFLRHFAATITLFFSAALLHPVNAQELQTKFGCNTTRTENGEKVIYADDGEIHLNGNKIDTFRWESDQYRTLHGFDCSVDESDEPVAEVTESGTTPGWRVTLKNAAAARDRRGFDFYNHGKNCSIRLQREGDTLSIKPTCPALCGSRVNFTELSVNLKTGVCQHEE
ncbi:hypothetical protein [Glaciimonas immobilis]|uniref:Uncharacterized protein n=1 Tax=Glaciimonas immobilis TaxID=728004 RepID=A0A840S004_9BURK|nr:hypothetical protein [Glaciimonas immobilis]KAF3997189.1 hypothetical protein HAV38_16140 [Glaciimonas immobilis]MBB5202224.1 hypothetical protein [Glaciimonas immobilis]